MWQVGTQPFSTDVAELREVGALTCFFELSYSDEQVLVHLRCVFLDLQCSFASYYFYWEMTHSDVRAE